MWLRESVIFITFLFLRCSMCVLAAVGDNQAEFNALCYITRLIEAANKLEKPEFGEGVNTTLAELNILNMSVAPEAWRNLFGSEGALQIDEKKEPFSTLSEPELTNWKQNWERWQRGARSYKKRKGHLEVSGDELVTKAVAKRVDRLYRAALSLRDKFDDYKQQAEEARNSVDEFLTTALEGAKAKDGSKRVTFHAGGWAKGCGDAGAAGLDADPETGGPGASIQNDMVCICGFSTSGQTNTPCGHGINLSGSKDYDSRGNAKNAWPVLLKACPHHTGAIPTEHALEGALAGFFSLIGKNPIASGHAAGPYTFGKGHATPSNHCDGTTSQTSCVNYKKQLEGESAKGILWVTNIRTAIVQLRTANKYARLANETAARIEGLLTTAEAETEAARGLGSSIPGQGLSNKANLESQTGSNKQTSGEKPQEKGLVASSTTYTFQHFFLMWALLI